MSRTRLILMPARADEAAPWMTLDSTGAVLERGRASLEHPAPAGPHRNVAIVPGARVTLRRLTVPSGSPAQQRAAALWALRDDLAGPADRLRAALGPVEDDGARWVAAVDLPVVEAWADWLRAAGFGEAAMAPDCMTLDPPTDGSAAAVRFGDDVALRATDLAVTVQPDLVDAVAAPRAVHAVEDPAEVEALLIRAALSPPLDLAAGRGRAAGAAGSWRRAALLAAALVLSPLILILAEAARDEMAARDIDARAETAARAAFPDMPPEADPLAEAERRLGTAPPPGGVAAASAALFQALEGVPGAELDSLTADPAGGIRASVSYAAYQDLDVLRSAMAELGLTLTDTSTVDDGGRVVSDVIIGARS